MNKIWQVKQLESLTLDIAVKNRARDMLETLNEHYGENREVTDMGGYVLVDEESIEEWFQQYTSVEPEFIESFMGDDGYTYLEIVYLLSSDDHVICYCLEDSFNDWKGGDANGLIHP